MLLESIDWILDIGLRRRYNSGLKNFFSLYKPLADSWQLYDNSNNLFLIASSVKHNPLIIQDPNRWKHLQEIYSD